MEQLDFDATNGNGASADNTDAAIYSGETTAPSIDGNGGMGQAQGQSRRNLMRVLRRRLKKDSMTTRSVRGQDYAVNLSPFHLIDDPAAALQRLGVFACEFCHWRSMKVSRREGMLMCSQCATELYRRHCTGNGG